MASESEIEAFARELYDRLEGPKGVLPFGEASEETRADYRLIASGLIAREEARDAMQSGATRH